MLCGRMYVYEEQVLFLILIGFLTGLKVAWCNGRINREAGIF